MKPATDELQNWVAGLVEAARLKGVLLTQDEMLDRTSADTSNEDWMPALTRAARCTGMQFQLLNAPFDSVPDVLYPLLVELEDGNVAVVRRRASGVVLFLVPALGGAAETECAVDEFARKATGRIGLVEPLASRTDDARLDDFLARRPKSWLRDILLRDWRSYGEIALASFVGNVLTFGTSLFAMQVWDRVIPARSIPTLWVLALGVATALIFDLILRTARVSLADRVGKKADLAISSLFFARALNIRNDARPKSTGAFIAQLRDIEQLRELLASTTVAALIDLPFVLLFLAFFAMIAGPIIYVPLAALVLIVVPGILLQFPLSRLSREGMRESALRNAILTEAVERIEDVKALQAEARFQSKWERLTLAGAQLGMAQRWYVSFFGNWAQTLQQLAYTAVLVAGTYRVLDGEMSMGALIACSILTNRAVVLFMPLGQVFARWQSAKVAVQSLNDLLERPVDHDPSRHLVRRHTLKGNYTFRKVRYAYSDESATVLDINSIVIRPGERIALLGRIGAGKSTLLRLMAGMALPSQGQLLLDNTDISLINPADVRREISYLGQGGQLFLGTIRDNLTLGAPRASDDDILKALSVVGGLPLVQNQSQGLDLMLQEGGAGLSGGQRQALLLARTLLRQGNVILLDEPSAPMDENTERHFVEQMGRWLGDRTLVLTTNRTGILGLVDRIIVLDGGRVVLDGPKAEVLGALSRPAQKPVAVAG